MDYPYDTSAQPPAPMVPVVLRQAESDEREELRAYLDTGSDISLVPHSSVQRLKLESIGLIGVRGFVGGVTTRPLFAAVVEVQQVRWPERVIAWQQPFAILGRSILNRWQIILNGPTLTTTIE